MASKLDILVTAKNNASPALKQVGVDLAGIDKHAGSAADGLKGLALAGGAAGLVALGSAAIGTGFELSRLAATATDIETSFNTMAKSAGESGDAMLAGLRESSRGAIADMDLMLAANRAMLLGVADSTQELTDLMDVARARSQAMGTTTTEAFSDLVTGLGRGSVQILDNLGIMLDAEQVNQAYAQSIGKTAEALTDQEKKQALVNAVIRESASLVRANEAAGDDAASNFERMDAAITNAKVAMGELFSPAMIVVANALADAATDMTDAMHNAAEAEAEMAQPQDFGDWLSNLRAMNASFRDQAIASRIAQEGVDGLGGANFAYAEAAGKADAITHDLTFGFNALGAAGGIAAEGIRRVGEIAPWAAGQLAALKAQSDATRASLAATQSAALGKLESAAMGAIGAGAMSASEAARIYGPAEERLRAQQKALEAVGYEGAELKFKMEELAARSAEPFTNATEATREAEREARKYASALSGSGGGGGGSVTDAVAEAEAAFESLRGKVAGVLSGALDTGTGVDPDKALEAMGFPRADAINENARRLADIAANGLKGQDWLGEFQKEVPDIWNMIRLAQNPQAEAAMLLRDFQDGLLTSPIDRGMAKEIVKRAIMGEQNMAALATEIANELSAEMGIPLSQALAAAQGTLGGGTGAGELAQNFTDGAIAGLTEAGGGIVFVDTFVEQMKARYTLLSSAGKEAGTQWGASFMAAVGDNVPSALISLLTELVTPGVFAKFAQQGSLTSSAS